MKILTWRLPPLCGFCFIALASALPFVSHAASSSHVKKLFAQPPREYSSAPLWVWNDQLTEQEILGTMRDLAQQRVKQVFIHPRPGLMTPYLSPEWFRLWKAALTEADRLDMNVWIYDENSYPSGFAGGWVPEQMPSSRGQGLILREASSAPKWTPGLLRVYRIQNDHQWEDISVKIKSGEILPEGRYVTASIQQAANSPWNGNRSYVNLLTPGVTEKFLEVTLGAYDREFGRQFGRRIPGVFTDEPNIRPAGGLPWCDDLPQQFQHRWGYDLLQHLPSLLAEVGDWRKVRHNYFATLNDLFIERWAKPYHDYCEQHRLEFTGHYWDHEWPNCGGVPDNMAMYAWHQRPAIDCLMNQYAENTHAQFGNVRMVKELSSVANQLGRKRTLCEIYGAGGWDLRFEDMKRIADWLGVLGVNTFDEHLSYVTIRGARKRDHPQSFSYHEPWWEAYHVHANYLTRLSCALSQGEQINNLLVIEPTTTAWMYQGNGARLSALGDAFCKLLMALESHQVEFDLGCEDLIARHGSLQDGQLVVGQRRYRDLFVPFAENLNSKTEELIGEHGLWTEPMPMRTDGKLTGGPHQIPLDRVADRPPPKFELDTDFYQALAALHKPEGFSIERAPEDKGILFHQRRQLDDGQLLFLVNTSLESPSSGIVESDLKGVEKWNLYTGEIEPYPFAATNIFFSESYTYRTNQPRTHHRGSLRPGVAARFQLPPSGSLLLFLSRKPLRPNEQPPVHELLVKASASDMQIRRLQPNVLTLDYVDVLAGGETRTNLYFYQANRFVWQKNGVDRNPWDSAVQFQDEIISKSFPAESGFTATYRFVVGGTVPKDLAMVIERPDLYAINCNGKPVSATRGEWWLDRSFGKIDLSETAQPGPNTVTIAAKPFTVFHELEPAYLLGDFSLKPSELGFTVVPEQPLKPGQWNAQGHPFYAGGVAYAQQFDIEKARGRYSVTVSNWYGSVAKVLVNGKNAGYITAPPWECDVTRLLKRGPNTVELVVFGTLKNTLGPHHGRPGLGSAWPAMFQKGENPGPPPGAKYATVGYGLFEPFALRQRQDAR